MTTCPMSDMALLQAGEDAQAGAIPMILGTNIAAGSVAAAFWRAAASEHRERQVAHTQKDLQGRA